MSSPNLLPTLSPGDHERVFHICGYISVLSASSFVFSSTPSHCCCPSSGSIPFLNCCSHLTAVKQHLLFLAHFYSALFCSIPFWVLFRFFPPPPSPASSSLSFAFSFFPSHSVPIGKFRFKNYDLSQRICSQRKSRGPNLIGPGRDPRVINP